MFGRLAKNYVTVGSPTSVGHGPIVVNIYGGTFLPLQGLLVGDERGSEILTVTDLLVFSFYFFFFL